MKVCSFFVSDAHLLTIILPYIDEKINEGKNVAILSERNLKEVVDNYLKSVKKFDKVEIRKVFQEKLDKLDNNTVVISTGTKKFINNVVVSNCAEKVDCYEIETIYDVKEIMENYEYYLRTDGIKAIKNSQNEQNSNTIKSQL